MPQHRSISTVFPRVSRRIKVATAAPVFIANTPQLNPKGLYSAIPVAFFDQRSIDRCIAIFKPVAKFLRGARSYVSSQIRFRAESPAEVDEFVCAQAVIVLNLETTGHSQSARSLFRRADAIAPV